MKILMIIAVLVMGLVIYGCGDEDNTKDSTAIQTTEIETPTEVITPIIEMPGVTNLLNNKWVLTDVNDSTEQWILGNDVRIDLNFAINDGINTITGFSGCNTYRGTFGIDDNAIYVANLSSTEKSCQPTKMHHENEYISALNEAHSFHFDDDGDTLVIMYGMTVPNDMTFDVAPTPPPPTASITQEPEVTTPPVIPTPQILPGTVTVSIYLGIQATGTQTSECEFPINVGFYPPGSSPSTLMDSKSALFYFSGTTTCVSTTSGTKTMVTVGPLNPGTYDITADSPTSLMNVKRGVGIK